MINSEKPATLNERGTALIMSVMLGLIFLSGLVWFSTWSWDRGRSQRHESASQYAYEYADSCLASANPWLKSPALLTALPAHGTTTFVSIMPKGRCEAALNRTFTDSNLVEVFTTGYYYLPLGTRVDPGAGNRRCQLSVLHGIYRVTNVAEFLAAVPGDLVVTYGANAPGGTVFAQNLKFAPPGVGGPTQIGPAYFTNSVTPALPSYVVFHSTPAAPQQLSYPPMFAPLDAQMEMFYQQSKTAFPTPVFSGTVSAPTDHPVYYVIGDVHVGNGTDLIVNGVWMLYATGNIYIDGNIIKGTPTSWAAFLAEGDIRIEPAAPDALSLTGNFICNGMITADGAQRPAGVINFTGGLVTESGIDLSTVYPGPNLYTYDFLTNPAIILPNVTDLLQRDVVSGNTDK